MIPRQHRLDLRHQPDFFAHADRFYGQQFTIFYRRTAEKKDDKLAVIVPKKNNKLRVDRSWLKRQLASLTIPFLSENGLELVISVSVAKKDFERNSAEKYLKKFFSKLGND